MSITVTSASSQTPFLSHDEPFLSPNNTLHGSPFSFSNYYPTFALEIKHPFKMKPTCIKFVLLLGFLLCLIPLEAQKVKAVSLKPDRFNAQMEQTVNRCIIDVRPAVDFAAGHIADAVNLDPLDFQFVKNVQQLCATTDTLFVYCKMGKTSKTASQALVSKGFKHVYGLKGGILAWAKKFPVVTP